jgi:hypothetical protein
MKAKPAIGLGMLASLLALALAACGGARVAPANPGDPHDAADVAPPDAAALESAPDVAVVPAEASVKPSADPNACPATFHDAEKARSCVFAVTPACKYAEGACGCEPQRNCGGAQMRNTGPGDPGSWRCGSTDPRRLDPQGCPYVAPTAGAACATAGKYCFYGACSWAGTAATCSAGAWHLAQIMGPPPP